jgi:hypothetical protein
MTTAIELERARYLPGMGGGHYESFFVRANHPSRPLAFWIRYTIFSPRHAPHSAVGELWAVWFDGETHEHVAAKTDVPIDRCVFSRDEVRVRIGAAELDAEDARGEIPDRNRQIAWDLEFGCDENPLLLLPAGLYDAGFPRAKTLVPGPLTRFRGKIVVAGKEHAIEDWIGSRNHNWGSRHTDEYAWGQVAGFDTHPDAFLEVATAKVKIGPLAVPQATLLVLRIGKEELRVPTLLRAFRARAKLDGFTWTFETENAGRVIRGRISAPASAFVGLTYRNPPGGTKHCLNTKIGSCELQVRDVASGVTQVLSTTHRAGFEILTDPREHGIPMLV